MFLTVTPNSALDRVYFIDSFMPGTRMVAIKSVESVGGKGFDTSVALRGLNLETLALGFVAGNNGRTLVSLLDQYGIHHDLIWVEGETRLAMVIVEQNYHRHSHIMVGGYTVPVSAQEELINRLKRHLSEAHWVILAGSLPQGVSSDLYARLALTAKQFGRSVLIDCPGEPALQSIQASPTVLKMNWQEFSQTFGVFADSLGTLARQAIEIRLSQKIPSLVITCGEDGILAITPEKSLLATAPKQNAINAAGAGDATSAALAWRLSLGDPWSEALRWAAATGAAAVLTERTGECNSEDILRIYPSVQVREIQLS
ncbi:hexose kinase [uncultured Thermanaerothrix sp.]|uniref:1-phosphofructokinase family hexose kinase n=1 Tax=uncultured Thermanaerothrix sp. TaxID=1195149 RepID=UPI0026330F6C|nr:hexose kinase [uncultured Thermanaerothrix sp.]